MPKVHPLLTEAATKAADFRICPTTYGYAVWAFRPWTHEHPGWSIFHIAQTHDDARDNILERLDLEPAKPAPVYVAATIAYIEYSADDFWGWP